MSFAEKHLEDGHTPVWLPHPARVHFALSPALREVFKFRPFKLSTNLIAFISVKFLHSKERALHQYRDQLFFCVDLALRMDFYIFKLLTQIEIIMLSDAK